MAEYNIDESINQFEDDVKLIKSFTHDSGSVLLGGQETPTLKTMVNDLTTSINSSLGKNALTKRNTILSARKTNGNPDFLLYPRFINMEHKEDVYVSNRGIVSSSSEYNSSYRATLPLRNQVVFYSEGWLTTNDVKNGWWQYDFNDGEHCLCGLMLGCRASSSSGYMNFPKTWKLLGYNFNTSEWEIIFSRDDDQTMYGINSSDKQDLRMYWFTENTKSYRRIRIDITDNYSGRYYSAINCIKFFEHVVPGQSKEEVILYASEEEPFIATISHGASKNTEFISDDRYVKLTSNVSIPGQMLYESSRNYISIVLADDETHELPKSLDPNKAIKLDNKIAGQNAYLYVDTRKINYCSINELQHKCILNVYCDETSSVSNIDTSKSTYAVANKSLYNYTFSTYAVGITTSEPVRGRKSSYSFKSGNSHLIGQTTINNKNGVDNIGNNLNSEFTIEFDCKYDGPSADASDTYFYLLSSGDTSGLMVRYWNRKQCISIFYGVDDAYNVPYNLDDQKWHHVSITSTKKAVYVHVDGKLINFYENPKRLTTNNVISIGRRHSTANNSWDGYLNNIRVYNELSLYTSNDYEVPEIQSDNLIPDKVLWRDPEDQVIKEYNSKDSTWTPIYMLPIGHIDTSLRNNVLTDQPSGTYGNYLCKHVINSSESVKYDANRSGMKIFNFQENGEYGYLSTSVNTTNEVFVEIIFEEAVSFDRLWFVNTNRTNDEQVSTFIWTGSNDGSKYDVLLDKSNWDNSGRINYTSSLGDKKSINSYKEYSYSNSNKYKIYRLKFPIKSAPFFISSGYVSCRLIPFFKNSAPEILDVSSNAIGGEWQDGPYALTVNTSYYIPVPFSNIDFEIDGEVLVNTTFQPIRRKLMQISVVGASSDGYGEIVYKGDGIVGIFTGENGVTAYSGNQYHIGADDLNATWGNYYLKIRQI